MDPRGPYGGLAANSQHRKGVVESERVLTSFAVEFVNITLGEGRKTKETTRQHLDTNLAGPRLDGLELPVTCLVCCSVVSDSVLNRIKNDSSQAFR